jgi:lipoyl(octanoyl) transferase
VEKVLRVVQHPPLHPCWNMALDEALLQSPGVPTLRVYGWSPPGVSLGYFQSASGFESLPGDHVLVRRITGGGAIYHADEITFALTADDGVLPGNIPASYELVHSAVAAALKQNGIPTVAAGSPVQVGGRVAEPWCFKDPRGADLVDTDGAKVLGSAQRRLRRPVSRVLHHGSLIVTPPVPKARLVAALIAEIGLALGLRPEPGELTAEEQTLADALRQQRYEDPGFTLRR